MLMLLLLRCGVELSILVVNDYDDNDGGGGRVVVASSVCAIL